MKRDDILKLAREQGLPETAAEGVFMVNTDDLGRMLAAEREACALVCEELVLSYPGRADLTADQCATAIRARGDKT